jgi:tetratricopeptide (TPR) repeat protein
MASSLCVASQIEHFAGALVPALELVTRASNLIDPRRDPRFAVIPRHNGIWILLDMGRKTEALRAFESLLPAYAYSADPLMLLRAHWLHARILSAFGRVDMDALAVRVFRESIDDAVRRELPYEAAQLALELSLFYESRGRYDLLQESITEALAVFEAVGLGPETMVARLLARAGEMLSSARELLQRALHRLERHRRLL